MSLVENDEFALERKHCGCSYEDAYQLWYEFADTNDGELWRSAPSAYNRALTEYLRVHGAANWTMDKLVEERTHRMHGHVPGDPFPLDRRPNAG